MKYQEFKTMIESVDTVDETLYNSIIEACGLETAKAYFEKYINYSFSTQESEEKFKKVAIYLEKSEKQDSPVFLIDDYLSVKDLDLVRLYLAEIGSVPLLTFQEEQKITYKMEELKEQIIGRGITLESINESLRIHRIASNTSFNHKIDAVNKKIEELKNKEQDEKTYKEYKSLLNILNNMYIYDGYEKLRKDLINANLRLVVSVAKRYIGRGIDFLDLIQEGNLGLEKASHKFEATKGYKFSTYATWWIRQSIVRALSNDSRLIRVPSYISEIMHKVSLIEKEYENRCGKKPTDQEIFNEFKRRAAKSLKEKGIDNPTELEIAEKLKFDLSTIEMIRKINQPMSSIYAPIGDDKSDTVLELIADEEAESVEEAAMRNISKEYLESIISKLKPREQVIIILRSGLVINEYISFEEFATLLTAYNHDDAEIAELYNNFVNNPKEYTLEEIGQIFDNLSRERVRQIEFKAFKKLQNITKYEKILARR